MIEYLAPGFLYSLLKDSFNFVHRRKRKLSNSEIIELRQKWKPLFGRPEAPVEAGRGDCHAASARGRNGRRGGERHRLAASYRARRLFGNHEEEARAHPRFGQRGARP